MVDFSARMMMATKDLPCLYARKLLVVINIFKLADAWREDYSIPGTEGLQLHHRLELKGWSLEWDDVIRDLDKLEEIELRSNGKTFILRNAVEGCCGKVFQAAGVALPPTIREEARERE